MKKEKILIINDYDTFGGASEIANKEFEILNNELVVKRIIALKDNRKNLRNILYINIKLLILSFLNKNIIVHNFSYFPVLKIISIFRNPKFVIHDYALICPSKSLYNYSKSNICNLKGYSTRCMLSNCGYSKSKKIYQYISKPYFKNVRLLSENSEKYYSNKYNKYILPNIDTYPTISENKNFVTKSYDFAFIGRYSKDKGYDRFLNLAINHPNLKFVTLGAGPEKSTETPNLINFGWINQKKDIQNIIKDTKYIIYPSRQFDADPIIVKQSLKLKTPVLIDINNVHSNLVKNILNEKYLIDSWDNLDLNNFINNKIEFKEHSLFTSNLNDLIDFYKN